MSRKGADGAPNVRACCYSRTCLNGRRRWSGGFCKNMTALDTVAADVIVIGAGFGGVVVSTLLARAGADILLVDRHQTPQPAFRAEQLAEPQLGMLHRLS